MADHRVLTPDIWAGCDLLDEQLNLGKERILAR
jgi:hypothetical protein